MNSIDVHQYDRKIEQQKRILEESKVNKVNKKLIKDFIGYCEASSEVNGSRIRLYLYTLRNMGLLVNKPFTKMTEKDIFNLIAKIKQYKTAKGTPYSSQTIEDYLKAISKFWRWLYFDKYYGEAPPQIRRIKTRANGVKKEPEIYTKEEIQKIINGCNTIRDKAFFACLYDLECRVSELLSRQIKHISHDEEGDIQILIESDKNSKSHTEPLFESAPYLTTWLKLHPKPEDPDAPLWTVMRKAGKINPICYRCIRNIFLLVCERQQIRSGQRNTIHMIRKSKATHDIMDGVPLSVVESRGSWSKGSRAIHECYILVKDKDKKNAYKKKYGIPYTNGNGQPNTELKKCGRCSAILDNGSKFCPNCGFLIDKNLRDKKAEINKDMVSLVNNEMLSQMIKDIVLAELNKKRIGKEI